MVSVGERSSLVHVRKDVTVCFHVLFRFSRSVQTFIGIWGSTGTVVTDTSGVQAHEHNQPVDKAFPRRVKAQLLLLQTWKREGKSRPAVRSIINSLS